MTALLTAATVLFITKCVCFSLDATSERYGPGRLINHCKCPRRNLLPKVLEFGGNPYMVFYARRAIQAGEEIRYDYGETSKAARADFPFLEKCKSTLLDR